MSIDRGGSAAIVDDRHSISDLIYQRLLAEIENGNLLPGQRMNDQELAATFGFSRTPVREAIQRLRNIGVVDTAANRFTRVTEVTPYKMKDCLVVWTALARAMTAEVFPSLSPSDIRAFAREQSQFLKAQERKDPRATALAVFRFFNLFTLRLKNQELKRAVESVVHLILLGSLALPGWLDVELVKVVLAKITRAIETRDLPLAFDALQLLDSLDIVNIPGN